MKTKTLLKLVIILLLPMLFSSFIMAFISFDFWLNITDKTILVQFLSGNANNSFLAILLCLGGFGCIITLMMLITMTGHADKLDVLDSEIEKCMTAKENYEKASQKLIEATLKK